MTKEQQFKQEEIQLNNAMDNLSETKANLQQENNKLKRLLEDLTPGGSEFYNDPQYCFNFVKKQLRSIPSQILPFKKRADKLKAQNEILLSTMKEIAVSYPKETNCIHAKELCKYLIASALEAINKYESL